MSKFEFEHEDLVSRRANSTEPRATTWATTLAPPPPAPYVFPPPQAHSALRCFRTQKWVVFAPLGSHLRRFMQLARCVCSKNFCWWPAGGWCCLSEQETTFNSFDCLGFLSAISPRRGPRGSKKAPQAPRKSISPLFVTGD